MELTEEDSQEKTMKTLIKTITVAVAVAGAIRFLPDLVRYMKIRAM